MTNAKNRREGDEPSWKKVALNVVLVGSSLTAVLVGVRVVGGYYVDQQKIRIIERALESITRNIEYLERRIEETANEVERRGPRILDNEREIERLRNRGKR